MNYPVFFEQRPVGTLTAEPEGLYFALSCYSKEAPEKYLFCQTGEKAIRLGILAPERDGWTLRRKIARKELPLSESAYFFLAPREQGIVLCGKRLESAAITEKDGVRTLTFPYAENRPFPVMEAVRYFTVVQQNGKYFWQCNLDAQNQPVFVDNAVKYDKINEVS